MSRLLSIGVFLFVLARVHGQEQFGLANSNYAGTDAVPLNPARMATQWSWMDIRIVGAGASIWNDHVSIRGKERALLGETRESLRTADGDRFSFSESMRDGLRHGFVNAHVAAPAVSLVLGRSSIGASVRTRAAVSLTGIGPDLARFAYNGLSYRPQWGRRYRDDHVRIAAAAWTEFAATYARLLVARDHTLISGGITGKYLLAHGGAGLSLTDLDYIVQDTALAVVHSVSGRYGIATPAVDAGRGFGADIGVVYERTLEEADGYVPHGTCDPMPYAFRLGISLLDIGGMRFKDPMAGTFDAGMATYPDYTSIDPGDAEGVDSLLAASLSSFRRSHVFQMGLPTAVSVQYDQRLMDHVYAAVDVVQNVAFGEGHRLRRPNTIAVVPRYERQRVELAVPVVFHEYDLRRPAAGVMLRLNNIVVGSDDLLSLLARRSARGADLYVRIKWTVFRSPACRGKKARVRHAGDRQALPCVLPE